MKLKTLLSIILLNLMVFTAFGQTNLKIGYADIEYILGNMPESKMAQEELNAVMNKLSSKRDSIVTDYNVKLENYQQNEKTFLATTKKEKETELLKIQEVIQNFEIDMQTVVKYKKNELLKPIYNKIGKLITTVAKANNYTHIINSQINGNSVILYAEEQTDISDLVIAAAKK